MEGATCHNAVLPTAVYEQAERILAHPLFQNSKRISRLLKFIVKHTVEGQHADLKERIIGIELFDRAPDFDSGADSSVRVAANQLRKRLTQYYAQAEHQGELRIEIPVGSYIAEFRAPEQNPPESQIPKKIVAFHRWYFWGAAASLLLVVLTVVVARLFILPSAIDSFWSPVVSSSVPVLICIGSPLETNWTPSDPPSSPDLVQQKTPFYVYEQRVNIGMMDVRAADALSAYLRARKIDFAIRPMLGTQLADLRSKGMIVYGMFLNDWAMSLGADLHYRLRKESVLGLRWIEDESNPGKRNWSTNLSTPYEQVESDYALITRVRDQTTGKWWIGITGLTGVGTLAANQLVLDPKALATICATLPKDWRQDNLQIVLKIKIVQGYAGTSQVVATSAW